jgi:hypothetical protein
MGNAVEEVRPWFDIELRKPRIHGWYAVQDNTVHGETFMDAFYEAGTWWVFGRLANVMNVRREVLGVVRWRFQSKESKAMILKEAPGAHVPYGVCNWTSKGIVPREDPIYA